MDTSEAVRVRYEGDQEFEILVEPDLGKEAKMEGENHSIQKLLFVQEIFTDVSEGSRASVSQIEEEFNTRQKLEAAEKIFEKGEMQLTTEQKKEMREEKFKQVVNLISRRVQNPQTGNPHPPQRIENALEEAGFNAKAMEDVEEQFSRAVEMIRPIIPVSMEKKTVAIRIPAQKAGKAYDLIQSKTKLEKEEWQDNYFIGRVTMHAGALNEMMEEVQEAADGEAEMKEV